MIKFREKDFSVLVGMAAMTALPMMQASKQGKEAQAQADQVEKSNLMIAKQLNKIASQNDPAKTAQATSLLQQTYSMSSLGKSVVGLGKDLGKIALKNKKSLTTGVVLGGVTAGGEYIADKIIQGDIKKSQEKQKSYSIAIAGKKLLKSGARVLKDNKGNIVLGTTLGMVPPLLNYSTTKMAEKDLIEDTSKQVKTYSAAQFARMGGKVLSSAKTAGTAIKKAGKKVLGGVSSFMGGGGYSGVKRTGREILKAGYESGNKMTQRLGRAIIDNPNAAVAASIPVGSAILGTTYTIGDKAVKGVAHIADKKAYNYLDAQNQKINE